VGFPAGTGLIGFANAVAGDSEGFGTVTHSLVTATPEPSAFASLATGLALLALAGAAGGGVEAGDPPITMEYSGVGAQPGPCAARACLGLAVPPDFATRPFRQNGAATTETTAGPERDRPVPRGLNAGSLP
jgi:hypothetical protein